MRKSNIHHGSRYRRVRKAFIEIMKASILSSTSELITCIYCGVELSEEKCENSRIVPNLLTIDHFESCLSDKRRLYDISNLTLCCNACNTEKGDIVDVDLEHWVKKKCKERRLKEQQSISSLFSDLLTDQVLAKINLR